MASSGLPGSLVCLWKAVRASPKVVVAAVASRDVERATAFARDTGIANIHSTYEALLEDPAIEAVYVPLPNNLHAAWAIRAAEAGKHVLCEKPLAATAVEARAVFAAARENGVLAVEAYPYRAQSQTLKMRELLAANAIGTLAADSSVIRISADGRGEYSNESGSCRRGDYGCRFLSG